MDLNKVMLIGNIATDPDTRVTPNGVQRTNFVVATNRRWRDQQTGENREDAQYHNIVAWRGLSDVIAKYAGKGKKVYIEGRLTTRSYEGQDGQKKYWTEVVAENIILLGAPGDTAPNQNQQVGSQQTTQQTGQNTGATNAQAPTNEDVKIPSPEEIPTINIDEDQEEIKVEDIPF